MEANIHTNNTTITVDVVFDKPSHTIITVFTNNFVRFHSLIEDYKLLDPFLFAPNNTDTLYKFCKHLEDSIPAIIYTSKDIIFYNNIYIYKPVPVEIAKMRMSLSI